MRVWSLSLLMLLGTSFLAWASPSGRPDIESEVIRLSNEVRAQHGLAPLQSSATLREAALGHSLDMQQGHYFSHQTLSSPGAGVLERARAAGCASLICGENLYRCRGYDATQVAREAVDSWLHSAEHRRILLSDRYNRIGVGVVSNGDSYVFTQDFAREKIEVQSWRVSSAGSSYRLDLAGMVHEGGRRGALLFHGRRIASWTADAAGRFQVSCPLPGLGAVEIGQCEPGGAGSWAIDTELTVHESR